MRGHRLSWCQGIPSVLRRKSFSGERTKACLHLCNLDNATVQKEKKHLKRQNREEYSGNDLNIGTTPDRKKAGAFSYLKTRCLAEFVQDRNDIYTGLIFECNLEIHLVTIAALTKS